MTYENQHKLLEDSAFQNRGAACVFEQAEIFKDDGRPDIAALAKYHLRSPGNITYTWGSYLAAAPGFADSADDSTAIDDGQILAAVQADWPTVAAVYFDSTGEPNS